MLKELATLEGHIREVTAQIEPLKQARASVKAAHSVRFDHLILRFI